MLKQCVFFSYADYMTNALCEIRQREDCVLLPAYQPHSWLERVLNHLFIFGGNWTRALIKKVVFPFFERDFDAISCVNAENSYVIVLYESDPRSMIREWLGRLRQKFRGGQIVYVFTNIITDANRHKVEFVHRNTELYDAVVTFNKLDADKYDMLYYEGVYSKLISDEECQDITYDVYFCGLDHGRLELLNQIYDTLTARGVTCRFDIIYPETPQASERKGMAFHDQLLPNQEMLRRTCHARCILEVLVDPRQPGSSLRMCEAVVYGKKLLTNNPAVREKSFYSPAQMKCFSVPADIDVSFILSTEGTKNYINPEQVSPKRFADFLIQQPLNK